MHYDYECQITGEETMTYYYECQITVGLYPISAVTLIEAMGWKHSRSPWKEADGCEYATRHVHTRVSETQLRAEMDALAGILASCGFNVVRQRLSLVVYDTKGRNIE